MNFNFLMLKPYEVSIQKYMTLLDTLDTSYQQAYAASFLRMEKWIFDNPDQSGEAWREYLSEFYLHNRLIKGQVNLGGRYVNLRCLTMPILNIYAENDHLIPPASSMALRHYVGTTDYTEAALPVGHVGMYVSRKVQDQLPQMITAWLRQYAGE